MDAETTYRVQEIVNKIESLAEVGYRPLGRTAALIDAALGGEDVTRLLGTFEIDAEQGDGYTGDLLVFTDAHVAHVRLTRVQSVRDYSGVEGDVQVTTVRRSALRSVSLRAPRHPAEATLGEDPLAAARDMRLELTFEGIDEVIEVPLLRVTFGERRALVKSLLADIPA